MTENTIISGNTQWHFIGQLGYYFMLIVLKFTEQLVIAGDYLKLLLVVMSVEEA